MTNPTWTPTPPNQIPPPEDLLAMFPDNTMGEIGAGNVRALVQAVCSQDAAIIDAALEAMLPPFTVADVGKVLTIDGTGTPAWVLP